MKHQNQDIFKDIKTHDLLYVFVLKISHGNYWPKNHKVLCFQNHPKMRQIRSKILREFRRKWRNSPLISLKYVLSDQIQTGSRWIRCPVRPDTKTWCSFQFDQSVWTDGTVATIWLGVISQDDFIAYAETSLCRTSNVVRW